MTKDSYYFSHDMNAQDDPKCIKLIDDLGMEGYGVFWALIEKLRSEKNYTLPLSDVESFAKRWKVSFEVVEKVIKDYKLFIIKGKVFFSKRLTDSMTLKSERARSSAQKRWGKDEEQPKVNGHKRMVL